MIETIALTSEIFAEETNGRMPGSNERTPETSGRMPVPTEIVIASPGLVKTSKGSFVMDEQAARLVLDAAAERGVDVVIDYEHHSVGGEHASPDGLARAAGWVKSLAYDAVKGLVAKVEWTPRAAAMLAAKEYRYLSPWLDYRLSDGRAMRLKSVSLVNRPATFHAVPIVAKDTNNATEPGDVPAGGSASPGGAGSVKGDARMRDKLIGVLALKSDASEEDIISAVRTAHEKAGTIVAAEGKATQATATLTAVCKAAGIDATEPAKIEAAAMVLSEKARKHDELKTEVDRLRGELVGRDADTLIASAKSEGKLVEAQEPWARELICKDRTAFESWAKSAPVVRPQGKTEAPPSTSMETRDRGTLILAAGREYDENVKSIACSKREYVDQALREKGMPLLGDGDKII